MQGQRTAVAARDWAPLAAARARGFRPPPGLCIPAPPGLGMPPPPGLDLPTPAALCVPCDDVDIRDLLSIKLSMMRLEETKDDDLWESDHSTAEPSEVFATLSRTSSAEKVFSLPPTPPGSVPVTEPLASMEVPRPMGSKPGMVLKLENALLQSSNPVATGRAQRTPNPSAYEPGEALAKASAPTVVLDLAGALGCGPAAAVPPPPPAPRRDTMLKLPSAGSALHGTGECRPCDFMYRTDNCREGAACRFCHLCGPQAVRQRRKQRRALLRTGRQAVVNSAP
uniref:C3H1-type domain-containing protein n=1 Tax=Alexandrium catenella TaxID=2925 RepID=A0A7S1VZZ6_ALECA